MKRVLAWVTVLAILAVALSAELPPHKKSRGAGAPVNADLKTASSFIGPFGYGWGWGYPYWGYGWGGWGGWGYGPYWG